MQQSLKKQTIKGLGWSAIERFSIQGVQFCIQIVLARLLLPSDYGIIGMLAIFIAIAQVLVDSGFANALIQKESPSEKEFSVVFFYNLCISIAIYFLLYIIAPYVSIFYRVEELVDIMRFLSLVIIFNSIYIVQKTKLVINVDFKTQTIISFISIVCSGVIGIILAYKGYGVWSLCWQQVLNSFFQMLLYTTFFRWMPLWKFDISSFNSLFSFGSKLMVTSLITSIYRNLYSIVIGKSFSSGALGCYTRAEQFAILPSNNIATIIARVIFPIFSKIQNDNDRLNKEYGKVIKYSSYLIFPLMVSLIVVSKPLILILLTDKWSDVILLLQILCLDYMLDHLSLINLNLLYVKGRSDLVLKLEIIKKPIAILLLFSTIPFGIIGICWGRVVYSIIATFINMYYTNQLVNLSISRQMKDICPSVLLSVFMGILLYFILSVLDNLFIQLFCGIILGTIIYVLSGFLFFKKDFTEAMNSLIKK